jgi:hypothetical protein
MVIARTKLMIQDDLLRPRPAFRIKYTGPNAARLYEEIPHLLAAAFRTQTGEVQEKKISWTKGETEKFTILWELNKDVDKFSYYYIELELAGSESKGYGSATISLKDGTLRTEYPQETQWERSLLYEVLRMVYHTLFYERKRDFWIRDGRRQLSVFVDELKRLIREWSAE